MCIMGQSRKKDLVDMDVFIEVSYAYEVTLRKKKKVLGTSISVSSSLYYVIRVE